MQEKHKQEKQKQSKKKYMEKIPIEKGAPEIEKGDRRTKVKSKSFT